MGSDDHDVVVGLAPARRWPGEDIGGCPLNRGASQDIGCFRVDQPDRPVVVARQVWEASTMTATSSSNPRPAARHRTAGWVIAVGLAVLVAATAVAQSWRGQLPDPVASHWGVDGTADVFSSVNGTLAVMLGFGVALVLGFGVVTLLLGQSAVTRRIAAAAAIFRPCSFPC
jgi:uncharacterized membrane protein